jgi:indolepyruvate ferredoxin oxidoreductase beta subunit
MMREQGSVLLVGVGGQGVVLASAIVADVALRAGYDVKQSEVHGMSQRGGVVSSHLRFGPRVHSPLIEPGQADAVVALEWNEGLRALPSLRKGSPLIINLHRVVPPGACRDRLAGDRPRPFAGYACGSRRRRAGLRCGGDHPRRRPSKALNGVLLRCWQAVTPRGPVAHLARGSCAAGTAPANHAAFSAGRALCYPDETHAQAARVAAPARERATTCSDRVIEGWCKGAGLSIARLSRTLLRLQCSTR